MEKSQVPAPSPPVLPTQGEQITGSLPTTPVTSTDALPPDTREGELSELFKTRCSVVSPPVQYIDNSGENNEEGEGKWETVADQDDTGTSDKSDEEGKGDRAGGEADQQVTDDKPNVVEEGAFKEGAETRLEKSEIEAKFIVQAGYGEKGWLWPRQTIAILRVFTESHDRPIYKNHYFSETRNHAEVLVVKGLKTWLLTQKTKESAAKYTVNISMNYSPCSICAKMLIKELDPKELNTLLETEATWEVKLFFSNFYKCHPYYVNGRGTPLAVAEENLDGLRSLQARTGFTLGLINAKNNLWEQLVLEGQGLTEFEKAELRMKYKLPKRVEREEIDQSFFERKISGGIAGEMGSLHV